MTKLTRPGLLLLMLSFSLTAGADHSPDAEWSWHVVSAGSDESRLSVYRGKQMFGIYNIACDLTDASDGESLDGNASLNLVKPESRPRGLLIVGCNVGAHSQQIEIIDLDRKSSQVAFSVTGSYAASWELQDGELWIEFDEPCDTGPTVDCPDGFATRYVQYPPGQGETGN